MQSGQVSSRDDKMQPIPLLQDEPQDYPHGGDVVRPFSVVTSERRDSEAAIVWLECFWWSFFRGQGQYAVSHLLFKISNARSYAIPTVRLHLPQLLQQPILLPRLPEDRA